MNYCGMLLRTMLLILLPTTGLAQAQASDPRLTTLLIGVAQEAQTFDPHVNVAAVSGYRFYPNVYESLLRYDQDGALRPNLARSWEVSEDGLRYVFELRDDVVFSDGTPFNAQAVVASFERFFGIGTGFVSMFALVHAVRAVSEFEVEIVLESQFAPILSILASWQGAIFVSPSAVQENEVDGDLAQAWLHQNTAGTGPFVLDLWEPENRIVMSRNPHYRQQPAHDDIQLLVFQLVREAATLRQLIERGDIDVVEEIPPSLVEPLDRARDVTVAIDVTHGSSYGQLIYFNMREEPFSNVHFRRAIASAIDYERLLGVWQGVATRAQGPFPETFSPWFDAEKAIRFEYDVDAALEELDLAGYSHILASPVSIEVLWQSGQTAQRDMATLISEDLARIGINLVIVESELPVWREAIWEGTFEMAFIQLPLRYNDPDAVASMVMDSGEIRYRGWNPGFRNPQVDEIIAQARITTDVDLRKALYGDLQRIVTEEVAMLYLVNKRHAYAYRSNVVGIDWNPNYGPNFRVIDISKTGD